MTGERGKGKGEGNALRRALRLIVILDDSAAAGRDLAELAAAAVKGGATMLQVRAKQTPPGTLADITRGVIAVAGGVPVIVNDRLDVALAAGAAGCHLGQDDFPLSDARAMAPAGFILGGSAGSAEEARRAGQGGAHYLGVGPIHVTGHKADAGAAIGVAGFAAVRGATTLPCVAVGGVTAADVAGLLAAGAAGVAVIGAILGSASVAKATASLARELKS